MYRMLTRREDLFHLQEKIDQNDVYIIAEMSANHGGSLDNALRIVRRQPKRGPTA